MAAFLRSKQSGIGQDLSEGILPGLFALDDVARFGINSQISVLAYDPVQSLLAVGTNETTFGSGQIYIFGQSRVQVTLTLPRRASIRILQFCSDRLVSVDSKNEVIVWSLPEAKKIASYAPPGVVTALVTDPSLDWALIGLQSGQIICYDLDREKLAPLKLPNFWQERAPRARILPIVAMQLHPKDIGKLLIAYQEGVVVYSFKQNAPTKFFQYEVPPGAPGGNSDPVGANELRRPRVTHALWSPSGSFICTAHDDESLVFWDHYDGRVLMARTLKDTHVNQPKPSKAMDLKTPFTKIIWACKENSDDSGLIIAGGISKLLPDIGLTFMNLGLAPLYSTSSWQSLSTYFEGQGMHLMPTPEGAEVVDICLIPRSSPHYNGAQDPIAAICLLATGELITMSIPSGHPISPTNQLHPSLTFVHPFITSFNVTAVDRGRWLGMTETRNQGPLMIKGGAAGHKPLKRYEARNIVQQAAGDGTVRLWDAGHDDEIENPKTLQVDVAAALGRFNEDIGICQMSVGSTTGEFCVGTKKGEVVVYRWGGNKSFGRPSTPVQETRPGTITSISGRSEQNLKEGLSPFVLYNMAQGAISALTMSDIGFIGVASEQGSFSIIDLRGPAVIFNAVLSDFIKQEKRGSFLSKKSIGDKSAMSDYITKIEFGVMTVEGDAYSSILCFVGTSVGYVATFKILPQPDGRYTAQFAGVVSGTGRVLAICPIKESGRPASATGQAVAGLRDGHQIPGVVVAVTDSEARIFRPASSKGAHKSWDDLICDSAAVSHFENHGYALVGVFGNTTRAYSLPGLKELGIQELFALDKSRISTTIVTQSGEILGFTGPSEIAMLNVWGTGQTLPKSGDRLYNPEALMVPRPTISTLQWVSGTQYISPLDLDLLIGGPDRPPSKRMMAIAAQEQRLRSSGGPVAGTTVNPRAGTSQEGWGEYMTRQLNERTEKLNIMGDSMERVQENSASWADEAGKWANRQKRNIVLKGITGKFF